MMKTSFEDLCGARGVIALLAAVLVGGSGALSQAGPGDDPRSLMKAYPELPRFFEAKEKQARQDTTAAGEQVAPEVWSFFKDARNGNWDKARATWKVLVSRSGQYEGGKPQPDVQNAAWPPAIETHLALEAFAEGSAKYAALFGRGIVRSIPRGAIYFGGTDPGRGLVTAFSKSHVDGDPFFTVTQNHLADGSYLAYLRRMYQDKGQITTPSQEDAQRAFSEYLADAQKRHNHDQKFPNEPRQMRPGENYRMVDNRVQVSGQVAVMSINALLAKVIMDRNPEREIYLEESMPLDWMYPHLQPHGWIMKVNRTPLESLSEEVVRKDREFWMRETRSMIGDWLKPETPVGAVCAFAEKVYLKRDLAGFAGDAEFVRDERASKSFSKLRSAQGNVYAWRVTHSQASPAEQSRMIAAADFALRQAFALCPSNPEAVFGYANALLNWGRIPDAVLVAETAASIAPSNRPFETFVKQLRAIEGKQRSER